MRVTERHIKKLLHESNLIENYDRADFDDQSYLAWRRLLPLSIEHLTKYDILKTQKIVTLLQDDMRPNWRGYYRSEDKGTPFIRDMEDGSIERVTPPWTLVDGLMDNWLLDYIDLGPKAAHIRFEQIHPFMDGNGRTGRILMWWHELKLGLPLTKITAAGKQGYYEWFK